MSLSLSHIISYRLKLTFYYYRWSIRQFLPYIHIHSSLKFRQSLNLKSIFLIYFFIQISFMFSFISTCPIPFALQTKCRCAIQETGTVYIYCARKQLTQIPHFNNSNILFDELVLSGNLISIIQSNAFSGLKLRKLELHSNPIVKFEINAFIDLANYLEELILSSTVSLNSNYDLKTSQFIQILQELPNLKRLSIRSFDLSNFLSTSKSLISMNSAKKLTQLSLQSCGIKSIENKLNFLQLFPNIERLDLSENFLEIFDIRLYIELKKLKILILSKNKIKHLNVDQFQYQLQQSIRVSSSSSLQELDLSYNGIETIDEYIFELFSSNLEILNLRNNELSTEKHLTFLTHLYQLKDFLLDYNRIEYLTDLYLPPTLKVLSLKNNRLKKIDLQILTINLVQLEKLYLSSNYLQEWTSLSNHLFQSLELLELDRNQLKFQTCTFNGLPKLKQLNLDGNLFEGNINNQLFSKLQTLERLQLRDNNIENIHTQAFQFTRLQSLDLRNNSLSSIPLLVTLNDTLQTLVLRRNRLCTLDYSTLKYYTQLTSIELDQNPLHCNCLMKNIGKWFKIANKLKESTGKCESPPSKRNVNLIDLNNKDLICSLPEQTTPQCQYLNEQDSRKEMDKDDEESQTITITTTTTTTEKIKIPEIDKTLLSITDDKKLPSQRQYRMQLTTSSTIVSTLIGTLLSTSSSIIPSTTTTTTVSLDDEHLLIRINELTVSYDSSLRTIFIQWQLLPAFLNDLLVEQRDYLFSYLKRQGIQGFKISVSLSKSPQNYRLSELLSPLLRNYTFYDYQLNSDQQYEICVILLKQISYEKHCKQIRQQSKKQTNDDIQRPLPPLSLFTHSEKQQDIFTPLKSRTSSIAWYLSEPTRSILFGSIFGILFVLILITIVVLTLTRCPHLFHRRKSSHSSHQDTKSETLLVRPTPSSTCGTWNHHHRPLNYQIPQQFSSLSTHRTCSSYARPSYTSSGSSGVGNCPGVNYHIYQEINDDFSAAMSNRHLSPSTSSSGTSSSSGGIHSHHPRTSACVALGEYLHHNRTCNLNKNKNNSNFDHNLTPTSTMSEQCPLCSRQALSVLV